MFSGFKLVLSRSFVRSFYRETVFLRPSPVLDRLRSRGGLSKRRFLIKNSFIMRAVKAVATRGQSLPALHPLPAFRLTSQSASCRYWQRIFSVSSRQRLTTHLWSSLNRAVQHATVSRRFKGNQRLPATHSSIAFDVEIMNRLVELLHERQTRSEPDVKLRAVDS